MWHHKSLEKFLKNLFWYKRKSLLTDIEHATTDPTTFMQIFCPGMKININNALYHTLIIPESAETTEIENHPFLFYVITVTTKNVLGSIIPISHYSKGLKSHNTWLGVILSNTFIFEEIES